MSEEKSSSVEPTDPISYRPDLPDWGVFFRWPAEDSGWLHPEDVQIATKLIPSSRVFRRFRWDGEFYWLKYGEVTIRTKPSMWNSIEPVDLDVGQQVEVLHLQGKNDSGVFRIRDILFNADQESCDFFLRRDEMKIPRPFSRRDLRPIHVQHHLRSGYYEHDKPKAKLPEDLDTLDVGDLS